MVSEIKLWLDYGSVIVAVILSPITILVGHLHTVRNNYLIYINFKNVIVFS